MLTVREWLEAILQVDEHRVTPTDLFRLYTKVLNIYPSVVWYVNKNRSQVWQICFYLDLLAVSSIVISIYYL